MTKGPPEKIVPGVDKRVPADGEALIIAELRAIKLDALIEKFHAATSVTEKAGLQAEITRRAKILHDGLAADIK